MDLSFGVDNGLDLVAGLVRRHPRARVLVLSAHDERLFAVRALKCGALGYITKDQPAAELVKAVRRVGAGKPYVSEETSERILTSLGSTRRPEPEGTPLDRLSDRERHVLALIGQGLATREIAAQLQVSVKTVERHYAHIKESAARRARQQRRDQCGREPDGGGRREA